MSEESTLDEFAKTTVSQERQETPVGEIPADWGMERLKDVVEINPDGFSKDDWASETFEYISLSEASEGEIEGSTTTPIRDAPSRAQRKVQQGDVLVGTVRPKQRSHGFISEEHAEKICSSGFGVLRTESRLNSRYLLQEILSNRFFSQMEAYVAGSGYPAVKISDLKKHRVAIPPIVEQRKIATVLYTLDRAIGKTEKIIDQLDKLLRGLMDDIFESGTASTDRFQETPVGRFPDSWRIVQIQDILTEKPSYGIVKPGDGDENGVRMIRATDIEQGRLVEEEPIRVSESKSQEYERTKIYEKNILLSVMGTVGRSMCAPKDLEGANVNRALAVLRMDESQVIPKFADLWFRSPHIQSYFETQKFGTAQPRLNLGFLRKMKFPVPPKEEQKEIVAILETAERRYWSERETKKQFERLKHGLQQDLLSGKVRTTDTNIEVPDEIAQHG
ncbi:hypothetical protein DJ79_08850 [Halorubrum ezzemoulense]|uniref:Type I restriction modification DNA specificity domain-containing protein n=1 Tax=Halorubrum ezzemoulense TaxID=337243 RepID=A0A256JG85_HALEZ|nr:restriction endonuclease subunit S [Halorubrum ezzemoulense]OYR67536.1 hypothetical protein DJ79_08850 [Halorubrum ezzemoulense]